MDVSAELFVQVEDLFIEIELPPKDEKKFGQRYVDETCAHFSTTMPGIYFHHNRGYNCRMYFNASEDIARQLMMLGYLAHEGPATSHRGPRNRQYRYRIDSNHLFWVLVRNGFKIGNWLAPVQPISTRNETQQEKTVAA
jgi:hypothetical protein